MGWQLSSAASTCIIVEHPEAVGVVVSEELPCDDSMVLPDHLQVLLIEALLEPRFVPRLLEEARGHVANNVHLQGRGAQEGLRMPSLTPHLHLSTPAPLPRG